MPGGTTRLGEPAQPGTAPDPRRALRAMVAGLLASFLGSALVSGASAGLVAAGLLPLGWLAALTTIEMALDLTSPVAVRVLGRFDPGLLLVLAEMIDAAACAVALALLLVWHLSAAPVLVGYLVAAAVLPLVIDVASELYVAQVGRGDGVSVLRFNALIASASAATALLIARPLGAIGGSARWLPLLFTANLALSLASVVSRQRAVRWAPTVAPFLQKDTPAPSRFPTRVKAGRGRWVRLYRAAPGCSYWADLDLIAPPVSAALSFVGSVAAYLPLAMARLPGARPWALAVGLAGFGLGGVAGPGVASRLASAVGLQRGLVVAVGGLSVSLGVTLVLSLLAVAGSPGIAALTVLVALVGTASSCSTTLLVSLRQTELSGNSLARAVGASHAFGAAGTIAGAWTAVALGMQNRPAAGVGLVAGTAGGLAAWMLRRLPAPVGCWRKRAREEPSA